MKNRVAGLGCAPRTKKLWKLIQVCKTVDNYFAFFYFHLIVCIPGRFKNFIMFV